MSKPGDRVGAIFCTNTDKSVDFFGYGVYEGDFLFGDEGSVEPVGFVASLLRGQETPNPRIRLDSGQVVWGCECWWGDEERIKKVLSAAKQVNEVDIDEIRIKILEDRKEEV